MPDTNNLTLADVYHPLQDMIQMQQAKEYFEESRDRNRIRHMQMELAAEQQKKNQLFQNYANNPQAQNALMQSVMGSLNPQQQPPQASPQGAGGMAQPPAMPSAPPPNQNAMTQPPFGQQPPAQNQMAGMPPSAGLPPNAQNALAGQAQQTPQEQEGQAKIKTMQSKVSTAFTNGDTATLKKLSDAAKNDPDVKAYNEKAGIENMSFGIDEDNKKAWVSMTKTFSKNDFKAIANNTDIENGGDLVGMPEGKYSITFDPVSKRITKIDMVKGGSGGLTKEDLTNERSLLNIAQHDPDPTRRRAAKEVYDKQEADKAKLINLRIPGYQALPNMPGLNFNHKTGNYEVAKSPQSPERMAEVKAATKSLDNQTKVKDMMGSFVKNLDFQKTRLDKRINFLTRTDVRLVNMPIREALMTVKGSPNESILSMYLTDISNDAAKLSTGSSASITELSKDAQARWSKIHDPNLSVKDLQELITETQAAAHGRISTANEQIQETMGRISGNTENTESKVETRKPGETVADYLARTKK